MMNPTSKWGDSRLQGRVGGSKPPCAPTEHHGAGSSPSTGFPPAPFTKLEEFISLAFRGGVRGPRLPSRIPKGQGIKG